MTVLIIGGAYQGKRKVAENLYADLRGLKICTKSCGKC